MASCLGTLPSQDCSTLICKSSGRLILLAKLEIVRERGLRLEISLPPDGGLTDGRGDLTFG